MKKLLSYVLALCASTTVATATNVYSASIPGGAIIDPVTGMVALPITTLGCTDEVYGQYDMCVDVTFFNITRNTTVKMKSNFNPKFTSEHNKKILVRYIFSRKAVESLNTFRSVIIKDAEANIQFPLQLPYGSDTYVTKSSSDGGRSWTVAQGAVR